ncbi:MAG TPA: oligoendopeptidase F, partial [Paenibacillus sp.]|nr:oligoendopeptidase F [Paenibacillus sp.]
MTTTTTNALPKRADMPAEHLLKLEDLYPSQDAWNKEYDQVKELIGEAAKFQGTLTDADALKRCFELEDKISLLTERLYVYSNMRHHQDMADPTYQALSDKAKKLSVDVG